jgi:hypothetical protein
MWFKVFHPSQKFQDAQYEELQDEADLRRAVPAELIGRLPHVFQRYDTAYRVLVDRLGFKGATPDHIFDSPVDFACFYALQDNVFAEKHTQVASHALVAALLVSMSMANFTSPPTYANCEAGDGGPCINYPTLYYTSVILNLLASMLFITCILFGIQVKECLTRPYTDADTFEVWMKTGSSLQQISNSAMFAGVLLLGARLAVVGYLEYDHTVGIIAIVVTIATTIAVLKGAITQSRCNGTAQLEYAKAFYREFCESSGALKPQYKPKQYEKNGSSCTGSSEIF